MGPKKRSRATDEYGDAEEVDLEARASSFILSPESKTKGPDSARMNRGPATGGSNMPGTPSNSALFGRSGAKRGGSAGARKQVTFGGPILEGKSETKSGARRVGSVKSDTMKKGGGRDGDEEEIQLTHTSSSFELAEKGANKVLIDSVQFQLDGLFTKNASVSLRRRSAWTLFEICQSKDSLPLFRSTGIMKALLRVVGLLLTEEDEAVELTLIALAIVLIQRMDRKLSIKLPSTSFQALVLCSLDRKRDTRKTIRDSIFGQTSLPMSQVATQDSETINENVGSHIGAISSDSGGSDGKRRIKRKFSSINGKGDTDVAASQGQRPAVASSGANEIAEMEGAGATYQPAEITKKLTVLWPKMHSALCLGEGAASSNEIGQALSMSCVSSFLVAKSQACASIGGGYGRFSTNPSFRGSDREAVDETLRRCQQSLSERPQGSGGGCGVSTDGEIPTYLQKYATQLICAMNQGTALKGKRAVQLWQLLGIIHASCYRHPTNQQALVEPVQGTKQSNSLPIEITSFLLRIAPGVMAHVSTAMSAFESAPKAKEWAIASGTTASPDGSEDGELCDFLCHELNESGGCDEQDLFMASLKTLVNLTHGNMEAATVVLQQEAEGSLSLMQMLSFFNAHLCTMRLNEKHSSRTNEGCNGREDHGILSPNEDPLENLVFSSTLNLVSLLTNLADSAPEKAQSVLSGHSKQLFDTTSEKYGLQRLAVGLLTSSSASFSEGIAETDELVQASLSSRPAAASSTSSSTTSVTPDHGCGNGVEGSWGNGDRVPVADLVLSAHVCMLLLVTGCPNRPKVSPEDTAMQDDQSAIDAITSSLALEESAPVRDLLPQKSWWLPMRTLKAFLALQNSTGIFLCDNLVQVLEAIRVMELQNTALQPPKQGVSEEEGDVDTAIVTPFAISTTSTTSTPVESDLQEVTADHENDDSNSPDWLHSVAMNITKAKPQPSLSSRWKWDGSDLITQEQSIALSAKKNGEDDKEIFNRNSSASASATFEQEGTSFKLGDVLSSEWLNESSSNKTEKKFGRERR